MTKKLTIISLDGHAQMPESAWTTYLDKQFHGYLPRLSEERVAMAKFMALHLGKTHNEADLDIIDTEERKNQPSASLFVEKQAFGNITFRFNAQNLTQNEFCRTRTRFLGATAAGIVEEIEDYCSGNGMKLALTMRTTF